jgi:hypothetical protein
MPKFERSGSWEEQWVGPSPRRRRPKTPYKQRKATRDLILLRLIRDRELKLTPRELSATLGIPLSTVRDALNAARDAGRRHKASRAAAGDDEE